jgi:ATP-binding cassette subfamily C protein
LAVVKLVVLMGTAGLAGSLAALLGDFFDPRFSGEQFRNAIFSALRFAAVVLAGEILVGEAELLCIVKARRSLFGGILSKLLRLDAVGAETVGVTPVVTAATDGVEALQIYYSKYLSSLLYSLAAPVYLFFILRDIYLPVAVFLIAAAYAIPLLSSFFRKKTERLKKGYWNGFQQLTSYYLESLRALTTVKLFNRDGDRTLSLEEKAGNFNRRIMDMMKLNFSAFLFTDTLIYLSVAVALILMCVQIGNGSAALSDALMVFMLSYSFFASVRQLMNATHQAITGVAASEQAAAILERESAPSHSPSDEEKTDGSSGIEARGVSYRYGNRRETLRKVDLQIAKGSLTALVGQSGCGKSTLASLLMGFITPLEGQILIDGVDCAGLPPDRRREKIVLVPQSVGIFSGSIADNLRIAAPNADDAALLEALEQVRLKEWTVAQPMGLQSDVGDAGAKLSGGQRQKIGIARALLSGAPYLLFDEATSSVDPESEREIWACIADLTASRTVLVISHRLSTVRSAHRIYVLSEGVTAQSGAHDELMAREGLYRQWVTEQNEMERYGEERVNHG